MRILLVLLGLFLSTQAFAGGRVFTIADQPFSEEEVLDARALPSMDGMPTLLLSFSEPAGLRIAALTKAQAGKPIKIILDGKLLAEPLVREPITSGAIEISGLASMEEAIRLARLISGKAPLPDSLEE